MISITHNAKDFFENKTGTVFIYGAGNAGYWISDYMNRLHIEFDSFFDREVKFEGLLYNGHPVWKPEKIKDYKDESLRVIVSPKCYQSIVYDLLELDRKYQLNALCLVPVYPRVTNGQQEYDLNVFLGYFRRKLLKQKTMPTFVSNTCNAGRIYRWLDIPLLSPTINTGISPDDFIKICRSPRRYLSAELKEPNYGKEIYDGAGRDGTITFKLDDILISFPHDEDASSIPEKWNMLKSNIQWDNLIFVLSDGVMPISNDIIREFNQLKEKHLLVMDRKKICFYTNDLKENMLISTSNDIFFAKDAIENYFDFLGWLNEETGT